MERVAQECQQSDGQSATQIFWILNYSVLVITCCFQYSCKENADSKMLVGAI